MNCNINELVAGVPAKDIKTYATFETAVRYAEKASRAATNSFKTRDDQDMKPMMFVVIQHPDNNRWTPVFLLTQFLQTNECGGYIGVVSQMGYISI